jgi:uncharacterized protein (UPF0332 family)
MTSPLSDLVIYRIERACESIAEARIMAETGHWNTSINRLYYSCFYAVTALLIKNNFSSVKHTGIKSIFNKEFVREGIVPVEISQIYNELFNLRHESDYEDFFRADETLVLTMIPQVEIFVEFIKRTLSIP